jgi:hypothetical protein
MPRQKSEQEVARFTRGKVTQIILRVLLPFIYFALCKPGIRFTANYFIFFMKVRLMSSLNCSYLVLMEKFELILLYSRVSDEVKEFDW